MKRWLHCCLALAALSFVGCAAYKLGRPDMALPASIHIAPVVNRTEVPQVRALLTDALREEFLRAGGWHLQTAENARARIEVTLVEFRRDAGATRSTDTGRAASFENHLIAEVAAIDTATGESLLPPTKVQANGLALADPSLPDSEYQELPALCAELAQSVQDRLASSNW